MFAVVAGLVVVALGTSAVIGATVATNGGPVSDVRTKTATDEAFTLDSIPKDMPGMSLSVAAESACFGAAGAHQGCHIFVLLDGATARPGLVRFDESQDASVLPMYRANSMQFVAGPAGP